MIGYKLYRIKDGKLCYLKYDHQGNNVCKKLVEVVPNLPDSDEGYGVYKTVEDVVELAELCKKLWIYQVCDLAIVKVEAEDVIKEDVPQNSKDDTTLSRFPILYKSYFKVKNLKVLENVKVLGIECNTQLNVSGTGWVESCVYDAIRKSGKEIKSADQAKEYIKTLEYVDAKYLPFIFENCNWKEVFSDD